MCLAIPGRIVAISREDPALPVAEVEYGGIHRTAQLLYVPDARIGEYVVVQAGFAIRRMDEAEARASLRAAEEYAERGRSADPGRAGVGSTERR